VEGAVVEALAAAEGLAGGGETAVVTVFAKTVGAVVAEGEDKLDSAGRTVADLCALEQTADVEGVAAGGLAVRPVVTAKETHLVLPPLCVLPHLIQLPVAAALILHRVVDLRLAVPADVHHLVVEPLARRRNCRLTVAPAQTFHSQLVEGAVGTG
jgi:hypothetical protein